MSWWEFSNLASLGGVSCSIEWSKVLEGKRRALISVDTWRKKRKWNYSWPSSSFESFLSQWSLIKELSLSMNGLIDGGGLRRSLFASITIMSIVSSVINWSSPCDTHGSMATVAFCSTPFIKRTKFFDTLQSHLATTFSSGPWLIILCSPAFRILLSMSTL